MDALKRYIKVEEVDEKTIRITAEIGVDVGYSEVIVPMSFDDYLVMIMGSQLADLPEVKDIEELSVKIPNDASSLDGG